MDLSGLPISDKEAALQKTIVQERKSYWNRFFNKWEAQEDKENESEIEYIIDDENDWNLLETDNKTKLTPYKSKAFGSFVKETLTKTEDEMSTMTALEESEIIGEPVEDLEETEEVDGLLTDFSDGSDDGCQPHAAQGRKRRKTKFVVDSDFMEDFSPSPNDEFDPPDDASGQLLECTKCDKATNCPAILWSEREEPFLCAVCMVEVTGHADCTTKDCETCQNLAHDIRAISKLSDSFLDGSLM